MIWFIVPYVVVAVITNQLLTSDKNTETQRLMEFPYWEFLILLMVSLWPIFWLSQFFLLVAFVLQWLDDYFKKG